MILVDTSVWIDHLRSGDARLSALLDAGRVLGHPFVIGEIALGSLRARAMVIEALEALPAIPVADHQEVMHLIGAIALSGMGIGYVDAHLIASTRLQPGSRLWTRDRRLHDAAAHLGIAHLSP